MVTPFHTSTTLSGLIAALIRHDGFNATPLEQVSLLYLGRHQPRTPLMYEPSLIVIAQGRKTGYLGDREIHYDPGQYLVQTLPLPFECETYASSTAPLLGVSIKLDPALLGELTSAMGQPAPVEAFPQPMASVAMSATMQGAIIRLAETLGDTGACRAMGAARIREVVFEALNGEQGPALRALVQGHGHYGRIVQALSTLHDHFDQEVSVEALARRVNMSGSAFHQHFKQITRTSPGQYVKRLRLLKAQALLAGQSHNVNQTALAVGYRSAAQFSRDYKRYFGHTPLAHRQRERQT
ncbi:AraC family transcriptional regulator N-terminal domain-containing protein [Halomonas sp. HMF6819]|uniref:AraC family transcriptional regulator n=1 Tax=Halomonas sp. HMF6819 TaxID=3373085 RepID=UPI0037900E7C